MYVCCTQSACYVKPPVNIIERAGEDVDATPFFPRTLERTLRITLLTPYGLDLDAEGLADLAPLDDTQQIGRTFRCRLDHAPLRPIDWPELPDVDAEHHDVISHPESQADLLLERCLLMRH